MATTTYAKPCLAGMPRDIGVRILPDFEKMHQESKEWEQKVIAERKKYRSHEN